MKNTVYRDCFKSDVEAGCIFAGFNASGNHCCTIDRIVQTRWFGCTPQNIINKISKIIEDQNVESEM